MKKVAIVGNPNVGKSLLFSRLTGIGVISSNYPGTTVAVKKGSFHSEGQEFSLLDLAGLYSLETFSTTDEAAVRVVEECDCIINVVDATNLERNLYLTLQLVRRNIPMIVCLNFWDETKHKGITIDTGKLEDLLGVPVVTTSALSGEGIKTLATAVGNMAPPEPPPPLADEADPWAHIGRIVSQAQKLEHRHHTFGELLADMTVHPIGGLGVAATVLALTFVVIRFLGEGLLALLDPLYSANYAPFIHNLCDPIPIGFIRELLIGHTADPLESFGILTTGVYISLILVFPYFLSFYLFFGLLEDIGYLPRLAIVLDSFFHRLGLHGYSSIPIMLGLGCKVPALMATRVLTSKRDKVLTTALILMCAPCLPQSAMILSLGMHYGVGTVVAIFAILFFFALLVNTALNRLLKGEVAEMFMEIPPYRMPSPQFLSRKLGVRIGEYFAEVVPMIVIGVFVIHLLDALNIIEGLSFVIGKPLAWLIGVPHDIAPVLVLGFLRKDVSIALLAPFDMTGSQFVIASIFMVLYIPCVASLFTLIRELGVATALKTVGLILILALGLTALLHGVFLLIQKVPEIL